MLGDMRPQAYPADVARRMNAMAQAASKPPEAKKPSFTAFGGSGQTLGGGGGGASSSSAAAASPAAPAGGGGGGEGGGAEAWPARAAVSVDEAAPTTSVQVRLATGGPQRFRLNTSHTVGDLKALVEAALGAAGVAPRGYVLAAGFPPKPLTDDAASLEAAGVAGAAVTHRWA